MLHGTVHPDFAPIATAFRTLLPKGAGGASLAVMHRGELVVDLWGGTRDEAGRPFEGDTLALSFSTTKGVTSTLAHILASQGKLDYDAKVARYWPEFGAAGKDAITVRQVMSHQAGLYSIKRLVDDADQMLDWDAMLRRIESAVPMHEPGARTGYHALTYGWVLGGLVEKVTERRFADVLRDELAKPLGLSGCYVGLPTSELARRAELVGMTSRARSARESHAARASGETVARRPRQPAERLREAVMESASRLAGIDPASMGEALFPPGIARFDWNEEAVLRACIPAANGMFDARSLARMYAMLANGGSLHGVRLIDPAIVARAGTIESRRRDQVLPMPMQWRLGYHRVLAIGASVPHGFGHFGFGGSGAFCDPSRDLAVALVLNHGVGTPFGDVRMWGLSAATIHAADHRRRRG